MIDSRNVSLARRICVATAQTSSTYTQYQTNSMDEIPQPINWNGEFSSLILKNIQFYVRRFKSPYPNIIYIMWFVNKYTFNSQ